MRAKSNKREADDDSKNKTWRKSQIQGNLQYFIFKTAAQLPFSF